jgi:UDP-N-acetyl-D-mannosaminuronic acid dehydrogenase
MICDKLHIDVWELIRLANHHPRVNILQPGCGVGGHCIAVDPWFIIDKTPEEARIIRSARTINDHKPQWVVDKVKAHVRALAESRGREPVVACFGLAFKADIDDLRESPALEIVERLAHEVSATMLVVEPFVATLPAKLLKLGVAASDALTALERADLLVLLVDHTGFKTLDRSLIAEKAIIDTRGIWT